jgi:Fur family ferric uptake transcriptional regulator
MENHEQTKETVKQIFTKYLIEHSLRKTSERYAILDRIYSIDGHFDIESLYVFMKDNNYQVSRATLYNNIDLLLDCKLITKHQFGNNVAQFEKAYNANIHNHIICTVCGNIQEFSDPNIKRSIQTKKIKNFNISHYSLYVYGTCSKCEKKKSTLQKADK